MTDLTSLTLAEACERLRKKDIAALELTDAHIGAVEQARALNAFVKETPDHARAMARASDARLAKGEGGPLEGKSYEQIVTSPQAEELVDGYVKELNGRLNRWETVKKFTILPRDLAIETGELTPSLKIKRKGVETNFAADIEKMYEGSLAV